VKIYDIGLILSADEENRGRISQTDCQQQKMGRMKAITFARNYICVLPHASQQHETGNSDRQEAPRDRSLPAHLRRRTS